MGKENERAIALGSETLEIGTKVAAFDGNAYETAEAEDKDLKFLVENSCMSCSKFLGKADLRIIPPQRVQEQDQYVTQGVVTKRYLCMPCYNKVTSRTRERLRARYYNAGNAIKSGLVRSFLKSFVSGTAKRI